MTVDTLSFSGKAASAVPTQPPSLLLLSRLPLINTVDYQLIAPFHTHTTETEIVKFWWICFNCQIILKSCHRELWLPLASQCQCLLRDQPRLFDIFSLGLAKCQKNSIALGSRVSHFGWSDRLDSWSVHNFDKLWHWNLVPWMSRKRVPYSLHWNYKSGKNDIWS